MILCTQTPIGWLAQHRTMKYVFAFGYCEESARKKAEEKLYHYDRAQYRVKLKRIRQ